MRLRFSAALVFAAAGGLAAGCAANLTSTPGPAPTQAPSGFPSSSPSALPSSLPSPVSSATPQPCGASQDATLYIAMSFGIAPVGSDYGLLFGFGAVDSSGNVPAAAAPIVGNVGDRVQFVNLDADDPLSPTLRSAAGFPGATSFPSIPYSFPAATYSPLNSAIGAASWSTGLIQPSPATGSACYSQVLTLEATGTYYFGDVLYYNDYIASPRGVVLVAAGNRRRPPPQRRPSPNRY